LILAQFGDKAHIVEPSLTSFRRHFPEATTSLYTDSGFSSIPGIERVLNVIPPFAKNDTRYGWHASDLYKVRGLLNSTADLAIAIDCDMEVVSTDVRTLIPLTARFGLCLPANPRHLVRVDTMIGADSDKVLDETDGCGYAMNTTPIAFFTKHQAARHILETFCDEITRVPARAPLVMWRASWKTGFAPYILPLQWCVCEQSIGIGDEIILHVGHEGVRQHYLGSCPTEPLKGLAQWVKQLALRLRSLAK